MTVHGVGGREHALAWTIAGSPLVERVWAAPGNHVWTDIGRRRAATRPGASGGGGA